LQDLWLSLGALVTCQAFCRARWVIPTNWSKLKQQDGALTLTTWRGQRKSEMSKHKSRYNWIMKWNR